MASDNFLEALLPLVAAGSTLASGLNNYTVGPNAVSAGTQMFNTARYWQTQQETQRQHQIAQLQHMGDAFAKVGDVANAQRIDEQVRALGGQPGFADVADARRARMQRADAMIAEQMGGDLVLQPGPDPSAQTPVALLPPGAGVMKDQHQGVGINAQGQPPAMARPADMPVSMPGYDLQNLYGQIWGKDAAISQLPPGSDERGAAIDQQLALINQLPAEATSPFPQADAANNAMDAATHTPIQYMRRPNDPRLAEAGAAASAPLDLSMFMPPGSGVMAPQPPQAQQAMPEPGPEMPAEPSFPKPAPLKPGRAPFPGSMNVDHEGNLSYNFTPEGNDRRQKFLVERYYMQQVGGGTPPLAAINALDQAGYGTYTEDLKKRAFNDTVAGLTRTYVGLGMDVRIARQQALQQALQAFPQGATDADRTASGQILTRDQHRILEAEKQAQQGGGLGVTGYLDKQEVELAGKVAGEQADKRTRATNEAELDKPLELFPGGRAVWRRLDPGRYGEETVAPPQIANGRQAKEAGYLNVSAFEKQLDTARGLSDIFDWTGQLEKYAKEIIKAEPGFWNMTGQAANLTLAKMTNSGAPTSIPSMDGSRMLTLGEVVTLYERELRGSQDFITRALGTVGTQTEGDVMRSAKNFAGVSDTKETMRTLFHDLRSRVFARRMSLLSSAFGEKAVADSFPKAHREWDGRGMVPRDYALPPEVAGDGVPFGTGVSPGQPRMGPAPQGQSKSKLDKLFEKAWVE